MPKYSYRCAQCDNVLTIYHSISDKKTDCNVCETPCSLRRLPSKFNLNIQEKNNKVGDLVKHNIKEFEKELEQEKEKLRNEFFCSDE